MIIKELVIHTTALFKFSLAGVQLKFSAIANENKLTILITGEGGRVGSQLLVISLYKENLKPIRV